jgi:hypothetical protein
MKFIFSLVPEELDKADKAPEDCSFVKPEIKLIELKLKKEEYDYLNICG